MGLHIQFFVVTHRGSSDTEIDHYISTFLAPAVVIYVFSRWGGDSREQFKVQGSVCFYEAAIVMSNAMQAVTMLIYILICLGVHM